MRKPMEFSPPELSSIYLGAANDEGPDAPRAYQIRKQIRALPGCICVDTGISWNPNETPEVLTLQLKPAELGMVYRWARAFLMYRPSAQKLDILEGMAAKCSLGEDFEKAVQKFIGEKNVETPANPV